MQWKLKSRRLVLSAVLTFVLVIGLALPAYADCSSIIVGKNASETGEVLLGHNEDNGGLIVMPLYIMPRMTHEPGEMIVMEANRAQIPQVEETWGFTWSETRTPSGASFSDGFINEWGVAIVSDNAGTSSERDPVLVDGGIGYGIRRIAAERAKTAREAVEIMAELAETYGYSASGRSYQVADKDEGWMMQLVNGTHYAAQRVPDDEVAFIPNRYTIREVDMEDTENFIVSPDLITYAIDNGWYTPAVTGDYSDFDFAKAYQRTYSTTDIRQRNALSLLLGREIPVDEELPFSVKLDRKLGIEDVKELLRYHYEGTDDDLSNDYEVSPHYMGNRPICASSTQESSVIQFRENPEFTVYWRTSGHACTSPYIPFYLGMTSVPDGFGWIDPVEGMANHFSPPAEDFVNDPERAWWAFINLQNLIEPQYGEVIDEVQKEVFRLEKQWASKQKGIEAAAYAQYKKDPDKAREFLTKHTNQEAAKAVDLAKRLYKKLTEYEIDIMADQMSKGADSSELVSVAIFTKGKYKAEDVDPSTLRLGAAYRSPGSWATVRESYMEDVNGDGKEDLVVKFSVRDVARQLTVCYNDIWLSGATFDGERFVAKDLVDIVQ
jgi:dipeptidase